MKNTHIQFGIRINIVNDRARLFQRDGALASFVMLSMTKYLVEISKCKASMFGHSTDSNTRSIETSMG